MDRVVLSSRPHVIKNNTDKICFLIDMVMPFDRNVIQKEAKNK